MGSSQIRVSTRPAGLPRPFTFPQSGELVGPDGVKYAVENSSKTGDDGWKDMLAPPPMTRSGSVGSTSPRPAGEHEDRSGMRETIGLGQLRSNACTYLERVAAGETIDVVRRGKLVATDRVRRRLEGGSDPGAVRETGGTGRRRGGSGLTNCERGPGGASTGSRPGRRSVSSVAAGCWRGSCRPATRRGPRLRRTQRRDRA